MGFPSWSEFGWERGFLCKFDSPEQKNALSHARFL